MAPSPGAVKPVGPAAGRPLGPANPVQTPGESAGSFDRILAEEIAGRKEVKFSNHAQRRLQQRQIQLEAQDVAKLERAVDRADQKGVRESLVLLDELALVVSVKNRTVITAMPASTAKEGVFTNIDGVVIA